MTTREQQKKQIYQIVRDIRAALHLDDDDITVVKPSTIPNAGNGLFAKSDLKKDDFIDFYTGEIIYDLADLDINNAYIFENKKAGFYINGQSGGNRTAIINHSNNPNCAYKNYLLPDINIMYPIVVCTKDIPKDGELLCNYGDKYWRAGADTTK
jgi:SET domain-containing protein